MGATFQQTVHRSVYLTFRVAGTTWAGEHLTVLPPAPRTRQQRETCKSDLCLRLNECVFVLSLCFACLEAINTQRGVWVFSNAVFTTSWIPLCLCVRVNFFRSFSCPGMLLRWSDGTGRIPHHCNLPGCSFEAGRATYFPFSSFFPPHSRCHHSLLISLFLKMF